MIGKRSRDRLKERRILLAEDNLVNQKVARGTLEKLGYKVDIAANGAEAVAAWETGRYHLILMDCQMPIMDGYQASREIRSREAGRSRIPIVALTADAMNGAQEQCLNAGMDDYLTKPLDRERLSESIDRHLANRSSAAPAQASAPRDSRSAAIHASDGRIIFRIELNSDRAARYPAAPTRLRCCVHRQRKCHRRLRIGPAPPKVRPASTCRLHRRRKARRRAL